jgi:hypothetical protein
LENQVVDLSSGKLSEDLDLALEKVKLALAELAQGLLLKNKAKCSKKI